MDGLESLLMSNYEVSVHAYGNGQVGKTITLVSEDDFWVGRFVEGFESVFDPEKVYIICEEVDE